jgi:1-acyl-sn-glycerol-3-phosphate acyltransferase
MAALRSLLFSLAMILSTVVTALVLVALLPAPFAWRSRAAGIYAGFVIGALKVLCGIGYRVEGRENIPPGAAIIFAKHQSTWETYALQLIFPAQTWVLKRELMWVPFFGWGLAALKPVAIDRKAGRKAVMQIIEQGKNRLAEGIWITIFPEGTRIAPGQHKRWGIGGAVLAENSGAPVVPVAHNAGEFWARRAFIKRPGTVRVIIGPPIETKGRTAAEINQQAEDWMRRTMAEISPLEGK